MAAVHCYETQAASGGPVRAMQLVSFENDLDSLRLAFSNNRDFPYLRHGGPSEILKSGRWQSMEFPDLTWTLIAGDFLENIDGAKAAAAGAPEIIFYDPFSGNSDSRLWTLDAFLRLRAACAGRNTELFTYSASTAVRATMLAAGWYVARGCGIGDRAETTIAINPAVIGELEAGRHELLGTSWLVRWNRSGAKIPSWLHENERAAFEAAVMGHRQFRESDAID